MQRGFEARFERGRLAYRELLMLALRHRAVFVTCFLAFVIGSFALAPYLGRDFFPEVDGGQILMHVRAHVGMRVEETARQFAEIEKAIRQIIPPDELETLVDNIGFPVSSINKTYNNTGTIGSQDGEIQIRLDRGSSADARIRPHAARGTSRPFPGHDVLVPAGRHHQPDPEFRRAGADRGANSRPAVSTKISPMREVLRRLRHVPGLVDARIQQSLSAPASMSTSTARARNMSASPNAT